VSEERHVHAPLVLASASRGHTVDDELALAHRQRQPARQLVASPATHRLGHRHVVGEGAEQGDRRHPGRHHRPEECSDRRFVGWRQGLDAAHVSSSPDVALDFEYRNACRSTYCCGFSNARAVVSRVPRPGRRVRGSTTGRPLMAALDLLGRRWTLRLIWELRDGPVGARSLPERCGGLSSRVLYTRLRELVTAGVIEKDDESAYRLTDLGATLERTLAPLDAWATQWAAQTTETSR